MARNPVTVTQLNRYLKDTVAADIFLSNIRVTGEITNLNYHNSGHVFFSIRDKESIIECNLWSSVLPRIRYRLEEGMQIIISGYIDFYPKNGRIKLIVRDIDIEGEGDLAVAFEKMKIKLNAEGLFDPARKRPLPAFPKKIAVVTAPDGAAVQDIIKTITMKNDFVDIIVWPCKVQGKGSAEDIAAGIRGVNEKISDADIIICGRGGGSKEDLWSFNEEVVARAIYESAIPVISAVGHDIDTSISDLVADVRAATPTAAGEIAVPDMRKIRMELEENASSLARYLELFASRMEMMLGSRDPAQQRSALMERILRSASDTDSRMMIIQNALTSKLDRAASDIRTKKAELDALDPSGIISRGYSIVKDVDGNIISSTNDVKAGDQIHITMRDGTVSADVTGKGELPNG